MVTEARSPSLKADNLNHAAVDLWVEHNPDLEAISLSLGLLGIWRASVMGNLILFRMPFSDLP